MDKLFKIYKKMLELHIGTKASDMVFHQASEGFYTTLFDIFHQISEKKQDLGIDEPIDCNKAKEEAHQLFLDTILMLEEMISENKDIGLDNLLRGLLDKAQSDFGTSRGFVKKETEIEEEKTEE